MNFTKSGDSGVVQHASNTAKMERTPLGGSGEFKPLVSVLDDYS